MTAEPLKNNNISTKFSFNNNDIDNDNVICDETKNLSYFNEIKAYFAI